jgi:hypothetical protein
MFFVHQVKFDEFSENLHSRRVSYNSFELHSPDGGGSVKESIVLNIKYISVNLHSI